jgi:plasmid maintenance system antidote protein VapI
VAEVLSITQGHVSPILNGARELSKASIRQVSVRFKLDPATRL